MKEVKIVEICEVVLARLSKMDYELEVINNKEQLVFPNKTQAKGDVKRISEQELRFLFVEEFKKMSKALNYSIETPTQEKYKFGKSFDDIKVSKEGQSALLDMCVFKNNEDSYERILNIEFKHKNSTLKNIAKDILKLMHEKQNGVFIHLLNGTNSGTLFNERETGVLDKLNQSLIRFKDEWRGETDKSIKLIIISLGQKTLMHHEIKKDDSLEGLLSYLSYSEV